VKVPYADFGPRVVPDNLEDEKVLFLTDIFPTGYSAIDWANMKGGETVAVFGCGPVGLMAQKVAWAKGASRVFGLDLVDYRLEMARKVCGSETINIRKFDGVEAIRERTHGRGADICVDAVGMEADRSFLDKAASVIRLEKGTINALRMACNAARRGGVVSIVGVYGYNYDNFPIAKIFDKGLSIFTGQAPVHKYIDELLKWIKEDKIKLDDIITHRLPLSEVSHAYEIFNKKEDNCVKVVLKP
jgi:alcohol dehydrogenase